MAKRYTPEEKERLLSAFRSREERASSFARWMGLSVGSLYRWDQDLAIGGFCEVAPPAASAGGAPGLTVEAGGVSLRFGSLPLSGYLLEVLRGLTPC